MNGYNPFERYLARVLGSFPFLKSILKLLYARFSYIGKKRARSYYCQGRLSSLEESCESFFGYYDKKNTNQKGFVLACLAQNNKTKNLPDANKPIKVALFSEDMSQELWSGEVFAYNWQQGARLQWLDETSFIFNDFDSVRNKYISKVFSVEDKAISRSFDLPVQDSYKRDFFLSINYQRLMVMRPDYGYRNLSIQDSEFIDNSDNDGIWRVEFDTGNIKLLVSISDILSLNSKPEFSESKHKFNHVMISPDGSKFIFMHRYLINKRRFDRLILADSVSGDVKLLSDFGMVSHCCWVDENRIIGYMRGPKEKDSYWIIDVLTGKFTDFPNRALDLYGDGHPHVHGDWFVTDTYPDKARMQHLILCNLKTGEISEIGEFFHGFQFHGESRCDLHPRFSSDGKSIFFDSVFTGERRLYKLDLEF